MHACVQAQRTQAIVPVLEAAGRAILLSGTPSLSKHAEMFPQLRALLPAARLGYKELAERYCLGDRFDEYKGSRNADELNMLLVRGARLPTTVFGGFPLKLFQKKNRTSAIRRMRATAASRAAQVSTVMIRRKKDEVLRDLPTKRRSTAKLRLTDPEQVEQLAALSRRLAAAGDLLSAGLGCGGGGGGAERGALAGAKAEHRELLMEAFRTTAELKKQLVTEHLVRRAARGEQPCQRVLCSRCCFARGVPARTS